MGVLDAPGKNSTRLLAHFYNRSNVIRTIPNYSVYQFGYLQDTSLEVQPVPVGVPYWVYWRVPFNSTTTGGNGLFSTSLYENTASSVLRGQACDPVMLPGLGGTAGTPVSPVSPLWSKYGSSKHGGRVKLIGDGKWHSFGLFASIVSDSGTLLRAEIRNNYQTGYETEMWAELAEAPSSGRAPIPTYKTTGTGTYEPTFPERDYTYKTASTVRAGKPGIIPLHGAGGPDMMTRGTWVNFNTLCAAFAAEGFNVAGGWLGSTMTNVVDPATAVVTDPWGNDQSQATLLKYVDAMTALTGNPKVHLMGLSHGNMMAMLFAENHPDRVASITGIIPFSTLKDEYDNNTIGFAANIATAWGLTRGTNPLPARGDCFGRASTIAANNIPVTLYYSAADTLISTASVDAYAAAVGAAKFMVDTDGTNSGHSDGTPRQMQTAHGGTNWSGVVNRVKAIA